MVEENSSFDSNYLFTSSFIYKFANEQCRLLDCRCLQRISDILSKYHYHINHTQHNQINDIEALQAIIYLNDYDNVNLLNDYNHLLFNHSHQFEDIYNVLITQSNNEQICDLSQCIILKRNQRDRSRYDINYHSLQELYCSDDENDILLQQLIDRIHCYYFHSFDIGYKFTNKELLNVCIDKEEKIQNKVDENIVTINRLIKSKRNGYDNVEGLERLSSENNKFVMKSELNAYSYGYRYFYWDYYKDNLKYSDDAHWGSEYKCITHPVANSNAVLGDWYIAQKYENFKQEILDNSIWNLNNIQWNNLIGKAEIYIATHHVKSIKCPRRTSAKYYDLKYGDLITKEHLIAMMIYCNYDTLSYKFSETYRCIQGQNEYEMKERHRNYYFLGKLMRECVECFGMNWSHKSTRTLSLYHGVSKQVVFSSLFASVKGPLSTSTDFSVALNFCNSAGMILEIDINVDQWRYKFDEGDAAQNKICCFDCQWLSDYSNEQEILLIGGLNNFTFKSIITPLGENYALYIIGILQATYNCIGDSASENIPTSKHQKQMVYRLLCHQLWKCNPTHPDAVEFKSCPEYIKNTLDKHSRSIKEISFHNRGKRNEQNIHEGENKVTETLFKDDNGWINLELITSIFPNVQRMKLDARSYDMKFLKGEFIYDSVLSILTQTITNLESISIRIDHTKCSSDHLLNYCKKYQPQFEGHGWRIDVVTKLYEVGIKPITDHKETKTELVIAHENTFKTYSWKSTVDNWMDSSTLLSMDFAMLMCNEMHYPLLKESEFRQLDIQQIGFMLLVNVIIIYPLQVLFNETIYNIWQHLATSPHLYLWNSIKAAMYHALAIFWPVLIIRLCRVMHFYWIYFLMLGRICEYQIRTQRHLQSRIISGGIQSITFNQVNSKRIKWQYRIIWGSALSWSIVQFIAYVIGALHFRCLILEESIWKNIVFGMLCSSSIFVTLYHWMQIGEKLYLWLMKYGSIICCVLLIWTTLYYDLYLGLDVVHNSYEELCDRWSTFEDHDKYFWVFDFVARCDWIKQNGWLLYPINISIYLGVSLLFVTYWPTFYQQVTGDAQEIARKKNV